MWRSLLKLYAFFLVIVLAAIAMALLVTRKFMYIGKMPAQGGGAQGESMGQGTWQLMSENAGIASMHAVVTRFGTVVMLDRTNIGASQINLTGARCRHQPTELTLKHDCTAHSIVFTPGLDNPVRPLYIQTDTWCSSGQLNGDGTIVQTGGDFEGITKIRRFWPCAPDGNCDWVESTKESLKMGRWYASNQLLPDGYTQIVVGGRNVFTYEYIPNPSASPATFLPFLQKTSDAQADNLYPFLHLLPDGSLFIFANRDSIILNYTSNTILKTLPTIPGEPRNYPSAGSSVMLPLRAADGYAHVEILVCGGAQYGAFLNPNQFLPASQTCGRIDVLATNPQWEMETMPMRRTMGDMLLLPSEEVLIINGAQNGCQGWGFANNPALSPVVYNPSKANGERFTTMAATTIPRLYHSTANLLPDGRVIVAGSNTHQYYTFTGEFPTELRVEAFLPTYLDSVYNNMRPRIMQAPEKVTYSESFEVRVAMAVAPAAKEIRMSLMSAPFSTHSFSQGQRLLSLQVLPPSAAEDNVYIISATAPSSASLAPPSYYMLFAVNNGIPSATCKWVQLVQNT
ncbi:hypothetical protein GOP47_0010052 [Adiantum capillus-veneris]|uniref:Galactose oxidase n=1 Tax=Adiantum capillus-veneris TaxID=13818 RepID=A0A9D4UU30_ADICA|nr:hypothetical protein GOP47_0010052 [Adiantum capillus-veneris]